MTNPTSSSPPKPRSRLIYMLALADSYKIIYLTGEELGTPLLGVMWSAEVMGGFYSQYLSSTADQILEASPELRELLSNDYWEDTVLVPYYAMVQDQMNQQVSPEQLEQLQADLSSATSGFMERLKDIPGDGLSALGDSLEVDVDTVAQDPSRLREVFFPNGLGLHPREMEHLENSLGIYLFQGADEMGTDQFVQTIFPHLLQVSTHPEGVELPRLQSDSRVWQWLGIPKPAGGHQRTFSEVLEGIAGFFEFLGQQRHRQELARYMLSRILRIEYGLNRGRKLVPSASQDPDRDANSGSAEPDSYRDTASKTKFDNIDNQVLVEALLAEASPAQAIAVQVYYDAAKSDRSMADICRELGRDPNLVRNNFQAFVRKIKAKFPDL